MSVRALLAQLRQDTQGCESAAEIGAMWGERIAELSHIPRRVGVEIFYDAKHWASPDVERVEGCLLDWLDAQESKSWDVLLALDIIEHLEKARGQMMIEETMRVGKKVILFTPDGFERQRPEDTARTERGRGILNPHQRHRSGWREHEFPEFRRVHLSAFPRSLYMVWP